MKILKLLNKFFLSILVTFFTLFGITYSEEQPVDIWNIDKSKLNQNNVNDNDISNEIIKNENSNQSLTLDTLKLEPQSPIKEIKFEQNLNSLEIKILGLRHVILKKMNYMRNIIAQLILTKFILRCYLNME